MVRYKNIFPMIFGINELLNDVKYQLFSSFFFIFIFLCYFLHMVAIDENGMLTILQNKKNPVVT